MTILNGFFNTISTRYCKKIKRKITNKLKNCPILADTLIRVAIVPLLLEKSNIDAMLNDQITSIFYVAIQHRDLYQSDNMMEKTDGSIANHISKSVNSQCTRWRNSGQVDLVTF